MELFPLVDEQRYIFDVNEKSKGIPCNVSFEIRFNKFFSVDQLCFAVEKCLLSADISGARCVVEGDRQYMEFLPPEKLEIRSHNFSTLEEYKKHRDNICESEINNRDNLFHIFVYSIDNSLNNIYFCFNHLIFDGISGILLFEKIQKVLLDITSDVSWYPFSGYLEKIGRYRASKNYLADRELWEEHFSELSTCKNVFPNLIDIDESASNSLIFKSSKEFKQQLLTYCAKNEISPCILIVSAFAKLISEIYRCERFSMEIPIGNRVGKKEKDSIGVYEIAAPCIFDFNKYPNLKDVYESIKRQSRVFYKHKDFDWNEKIFSAPYTNKYGRYIPQLLFSYLSNSNNYSMGFATLHDSWPNSSEYPISLHITDYSDSEVFSFDYLFWDGYISSDVVVEVQQGLEVRLVNIVENGL